MPSRVLSKQPSERYKTLSDLPFVIGQTVYVYDEPAKPETSSIYLAKITELGISQKKNGTLLFLGLTLSESANYYHSPRTRKLMGGEVDFVFETEQQAQDYRIQFRIGYVARQIKEAENRLDELRAEHDKLLKKQPAIVNTQPAKKSAFGNLDIE
jgi:hypothetical protein